MPLHTDYRPKTFSEIEGNAATIKALSRLATAESPNRALLINGPSGCGKTTLARIMAREVGAVTEEVDDAPDYHEMNASDFRGIDMVRQIRTACNFAPLGRSRVWLLDECHKLTPDAQEAMLKLLEHPPLRTWFILCTTEPSKLKVTLRRRCAEFTVESLTEGQLKKHLLKIAKKEGIKIPPKIIQSIAVECNGSPGLALSIMDTIIGMDEDEMKTAVKKVAAKKDLAIALCQKLMKKAPWKAIAAILKELDQEDPETVRRIVLEYYRKVLLGGNEGAFLVLDAFSEPFYDTGKAGLVIAAYTAHLAME